MGTRLWSEQRIKLRYPQLRYVRIHSKGGHAATIYAWNEALSLSDDEAEELSRFAASSLLPYVCFRVKDYRMVREDAVPETAELPGIVRAAALRGGLDRHGMIGVINALFPIGSMSFKRYDVRTGTIHFELQSPGAVTDVERELISRYLYEIVPVGSTFEVTYT